MMLQTSSTLMMRNISLIRSLLSMLYFCNPTSMCLSSVFFIFHQMKMLFDFARDDRAAERDQPSKYPINITSHNKITRENFREIQAGYLSNRNGIFCGNPSSFACVQ